MPPCAANISCWSTTSSPPAPPWTNARASSGGRRRLRARASPSRAADLLQTAYGHLQETGLPARSKKRECPKASGRNARSCGEMIHHLELAENLRVCPKCDHHFTANRARAAERICSIPTPSRSTTPSMVSVDTLKFTGAASLPRAAEKLPEKDRPCRTPSSPASAQIEGREIAIAAMDFDFIAATMGSVVGEKLDALHRVRHARSGCRSSSSPPPAARACTKACSASCRWRRPAARWRCHAQARLPYISVLTHPTTGGVERKLRDHRRHDHRRAESDDRLRRAARDPRDHAPGFAARTFRPRNFWKTTAWSI